MAENDEKVKRYEKVMANRAMEIGTLFEVRHKCENEHTFSLTMHEYYYLCDKANKMYAHILIIPCCPKCNSRNIEKLETPEEALKRHRAEHREERKAAELEQQQKMVPIVDEYDDNIPEDDDTPEPEEIVEEPVKSKKPKKEEAAVVCQEKGSLKKKKGKKQ